MKKLLLALAFCLVAAPAWAQCSGVFQPATICGNGGTAAAPPGPIPSGSGGLVFNSLVLNHSGQANPVPGRNGPLLIWNDGTNALAGQTMGQMIWIGNNLGAGNLTPGANNPVGQGIYIDNLSTRNNGTWTQNLVGVQQPISSGGGTGIAHGSECDVYASIAVTTITYPYTGGSAVHCQELVASAPTGSPVDPTVASWIWSAQNTAGTIWAFGNSCTRVQYACLVGADYYIPGVITDNPNTNFTSGLVWDQSSSSAIIKDGPNPANPTSGHNEIIDLSQSAGFTNFVLGKNSTFTTLTFKNGVNFAMTLALDGGGGTAQNVAYQLNNSGACQWALLKDTGNNLNLQDCGGAAATIFNINSSTNTTLFETTTQFSTNTQILGAEGSQLEWILGGQEWDINIVSGASNGKWYLHDVTHGTFPLQIGPNTISVLDLGVATANAATLTTTLSVGNDSMFIHNTTTGGDVTIDYANPGVNWHSGTAGATNSFIWYNGANRMVLDTSGDITLSGGLTVGPQALISLSTGIAQFVGNTTFGAIIYGDGGTDDIDVFNASQASVFAVPHGTTNVAFTGNITVAKHYGATGSTPTANSCAGFALGAGSTDSNGKLTYTSATTCSVNFGASFTNAPACNVTPGTSAVATLVTTTTGGFAVTFASAQAAFSWSCLGS